MLVMQLFSKVLRLSYNFYFDSVYTASSKCKDFEHYLTSFSKQAVVGMHFLQVNMDMIVRK